MFDTHFPYRKINHYTKVEEGAKNNYTVIYHNYCFRGPSKERYIATIEQYAHDIYVPKFYLQKHKSCAHKYRHMSNLGQANKVITTVMKILTAVIDSHPYASIAFNGMNSVNEPKEETKRFRVYSQIVGTLIAPILFDHIHYKDQSCYLLLNKLNPDTEILFKLETMFDDIYDFSN